MNLSAYPGENRLGDERHLWIAVGDGSDLAGRLGERCDLEDVVVDVQLDQVVLWEHHIEPLEEFLVRVP